MKDMMEIAYGTITGRDHLLAEKNNQDALAFQLNDQAIIAVVCDGCSSGKHSEVGAKIGAQLIIQAINQRIAEFNDAAKVNKALEMARHDVLAQLRILSLAMGQNFRQIINDYFLFTIVGAVLTPQSAVLFNLGDGLVIINNQIIPLGPFANNEPPYLGYQLISSGPDKSLAWQVIQILPSADVQSLLIATDGAFDLLKAENKVIPGKQEIVGNISQFWQNDSYYKNPDMLRRKLWQINRTISAPDWLNRVINKENGHLPDDTTLIVIRRKS